MLLVLLFLLGLPATASATWTAPFDVSPDNRSGPQVGIDNAGRAFFAWSVFDGSQPGECCSRLQLRIRSATGVLGPVQNLSPPDENNSSPQIAVNAKGDAALAWHHDPGHSLQGRLRSSGGTLGPTQLVAGPGAGQLSSYDVDIDPNANATFVWRNHDSPGSNQCSATDCYRLRTRRLSSQGTLTGIQALSPAGVNAEASRIVVDQNGDASFVWLSYRGGATDTSRCFAGSNCSVQARVRTAAGTLGALQTLAGPGAAEPQVAVNNGNAIFVWTRPDFATAGYNRIETRTRFANGALSPVQKLSALQESASEPQVAVNADGTVVFAWVRSRRVETRTRTAGGALSAVQTLSAANSTAEYPRVGIDANGNEVFGWRSRSVKAIRARTRSAAGALSPIQAVSDPAEPSAVSALVNPLALAVNPAGNAVASWTNSAHLTVGAAGP
jgi:hypothetical protein